MIVWAYRYWLITSTLSLMALAAMVSQSTETVYRATATLGMNADTGDTKTDSGSAAGLSQARMDEQMESVRGAATLLKAVDQLGLTQDPRALQGYDGEASADGRRRWAADRLGEKLMVHHDDERRRLYVSVEASDAREAARLANAVADAYVGKQPRQARGSDRETIEYLAAQLESFQTRVADAQTALTTYREQFGLLALPDDGEVDPGLLVGLERRLAGAREQRERVEAALGALEQGNLPELDSDLIRSLDAQRAAKERELGQLRGTLGNRHPDIVALQGEIDGIRAALQSELASYGDTLREEESTASALERRFQRELARQRDRSGAARATVGEQKRLEAELRAATQVYQNAFDSYDRLRSGSASPPTGPTGTVQSVDFDARAAVPRRPVRPDLRRDILRAGLLGLLLGSLGCLLVEFLMSRRIRCREDLERGLGVPVLAELPSGL
ncbi:MAG: GumC family protein [Panacagrimonas sp.]